MHTCIHTYIHACMHAYIHKCYSTSLQLYNTYLNTNPLGGLGNGREPSLSKEFVIMNSVEPKENIKV